VRISGGLPGMIAGRGDAELTFSGETGYQG